MRLIPFLPLLVLIFVARVTTATAAPPATVAAATEQERQETPGNIRDDVLAAAPRAIGRWTATDAPLDQTTRENPSNPPANGYTYENPFGERVQVQMISAVSPAAYRGPLILEPEYGFEKTAVKTLFLFGPTLPLRAIIYKSGEERVLVYFWVQHKDGSTTVEDALAQSQTSTARNTPASTATPCIVRALIRLHPADRLGLQARRDLDTVCQGLYTTLKSRKGNDSKSTETGSTGQNSRTFDTTGEGGPDAAYLTTPATTSSVPNRASDNLLPLKIGDFWRMRSTSGDKVSQDKLTVVKLVTPPGGVASVEIDITRAGAPWRKEFYSNENDTGIFLTAIKDETSALMVFNKALPLIRYGYKEGDEFDWQGFVRIGNKGPYPAASLSRVSTVEPLATPIGTLKTCRIDTIVTITIDNRPIRFPSVRWLSPGVGFARRAFADKGQPATSEVTQTHIR